MSGVHVPLFKNFEGLPSAPTIRENYTSWRSSQQCDHHSSGCQETRLFLFALQPVFSARGFIQPAGQNHNCLAVNIRPPRLVGRWVGPRIALTHTEQRVTSFESSVSSDSDSVKLHAPK